MILENGSGYGVILRINSFVVKPFESGELGRPEHVGLAGLFVRCRKIIRGADRQRRERVLGCLDAGVTAEVRHLGLQGKARYAAEHKRRWHNANVP
jgi:hypothetical protein